MNKTPIDWVKNPDGAQGYTWNPITGCLNHTEGMCKGGGFPCYAYGLANGRLRSRYLAHKHTIHYEPYHPRRYDDELSDPFYPRFWEDRLEPIGLTGGNKRPHSYGYLGGFKEHKPKGIFVCDMSDLFGIGIPQEWTQRVMDTIKKCPDHRFYLLTKQPQNLTKFSPFPDNCWVGVTATDYTYTQTAVNCLNLIKAKVKYISFEPLLFWGLTTGQADGWISSVDWVIIGALTGTKADLLPIHHRTGLMMVRLNGNRWSLQPRIEWVEGIVQVCDKAGIPVFLKDNLKPLLEKENPHECYNGVFGRWKTDGNGGMVFRLRLRQEMPK